MMCDQIISEVAKDCTLNANTCEGAPVTVQCNDFSKRHKSAVEYTACSTLNDCDRRFDCGDYIHCCYQQPPRALPIKPQTCIERSTAPLETDTIYKRSYPGNYGESHKSKPVKPCNHILLVKDPIEKCTIQKLSYLPHPCAVRSEPIRPKDNCLNFRGPLYAVTSHKHDFMPKGYCRRNPIKNSNGIWKSYEPFEHCTVNKLSYMPVDVCKNPPPKPILQTYSYTRPTAPAEKCTIQKLSYLPVCLPHKELRPWAEKTRCPPPKYDNLCTTYNLSYIPNYNSHRVAPIMPMTAFKVLSGDSNSNDGNTVYKLSYIRNDPHCYRPEAILPINGIEMPTGPMEKCTVQKLSYQPNKCIDLTAAIRPRENCIKPSGPMYFMTTQKHDFVPKPVCRRGPIKPPSMICRPSGFLERCTINKLSYMPVNVREHRRPAAIVPITGTCRPQQPMEKCTTYKLSYLPNCITPKEPLPRARSSSYFKPTAPAEKCTIQKLSYGPPGTFSKCGACCNHQNNIERFPKAGIC